MECGIGKLALPEFGEEYVIQGAFTTARADYFVAEKGPKGFFVNLNRANIAIKDLTALFALKVYYRRHPVSSLVNSGNNFPGHEVACE